MRYLLDTNTCIYIANERPLQVKERFLGLHPGEAGMSVITYGELCFGAEKSSSSAAVLRNLATFNQVVPVLELPTEAAAQYGRLRHRLQTSGQPIGNNDLWIASHCLHLNLTLITNNQREFSRIPNLRIENWT